MSNWTDDIRRTETSKPKPLPTGMDAWTYNIVGRWKSFRSPKTRSIREAKKALAMQEKWQHLTDNDLREKLFELKGHFKRKKRGYKNHVTEALSLICEASDRKLGLKPYRSQIAGAYNMYHGNIIEMATGEGKTLVAALSGVLMAWSGLPCHIITVNDYLSSRDAEKMDPLYEFCGLTVGCVTAPQDSRKRTKEYRHDIVYTTSKELTADFLRDRLALQEMHHPQRRQIRYLVGAQKSIDDQMVLNGIHHVIIDEADSLLIDEAVTPLIISRGMPNEIFINACKAVYSIIQPFELKTHYTIDEQFKEIKLTPASKDFINARIDELPPLFRGQERCESLIIQALVAREFYQRDHQYVIQDDKLVIVDEFTGRLMHGRTWREGLHQLVEAKEGLEITPPSETLARLSFQRFFRFFAEMSGMTGTAWEARSELWYMYQKNVLKIPLNKKNIRKIGSTKAYATQELKWQAIVKEIEKVHELGRPVLVGTRSVNNSEELARRLIDKGYYVNILNALRHKEEAEIIAKAGEYKCITVATNMAGRGTDIGLGLGVEEIGGLHVIVSECHESARIDRQLFGRSSRQGEPGSGRLFVSCEDELIQRFISKPWLKVIQFGIKWKIPFSKLALKRAVGTAQRKAQQQAYKSRRSVLKMDTWLEDSLSFIPKNYA